MNTSSEEAVERYADLRQLTVMTDPPWHFMALPHGVLAGSRAHHACAEGLWIVDEHRTGVHRRPLPGRPGPVVQEMNFVGSLSEAVAMLLTSTSEPMRQAAS